MGSRQPQAIGEFAWYHADIGVECGTCGLVAVYCDFEALERFRERGWSVALGDAIKKFRCRCGSREVRFRPVQIGMRPKPMPLRPAALRPMYREEARRLFRRGPADFPDQPAIDAALAVLRRAVDAHLPDESDDAMQAAIAALRPYCYRQEALDRFILDVRRKRGVFGGQASRMNLTFILRELGRPE